jgi:hypothetical protein
MLLRINLFIALAFATWPLCSTSSADGYAYHHEESTKYGEILRSDTSIERKSSSHVRGSNEDGTKDKQISSAHIRGSNKETVHRNRREQVADYCPMPQVREL